MPPSRRPPRPSDRLVSCRDFAGRRRDIVLFAVGDRIILIAPPGEKAVLELAEVGQLRAALRKSALELTA